MLTSVCKRCIPLTSNYQQCSQEEAQTHVPCAVIFPFGVSFLVGEVFFLWSIYLGGSRMLFHGMVNTICIEKPNAKHFSPCHLQPRLEKPTVIAHKCLQKEVFIDC